MSREEFIKKRDLNRFHAAKRKLGIIPESFNRKTKFELTTEETPVKDLHQLALVDPNS